MTAHRELLLFTLCVGAFLILISNVMLDRRNSIPLVQKNVTYPMPFLKATKAVDTGEILNNTDVEDDVLVLIWASMHNPFWETFGHEQPLPCEKTSVPDSPCRCRYTIDRDKVNESDAVMGDVRMYRHFGFNRDAMPRYHRIGQYWVLLNSESLYVSENDADILSPGIFNLSATYLKKADIHLPYGFCKKTTPGKTSHKRLKKKTTSGCLWYVSDCDDERSWRLKYGEELAKYINVDVRGDCSKNPGKVTDGGAIYFADYASHSRDGELGDFKFYLSFENAYCKEYMTEKVYKVLASDGYTIPVVRGYGPYRELLPEHSFINSADFATPEHLAQYLHLVNSTPALFHDYFAWRKHTKCHNLYERPYDWPCRICSKVCELRAAGETRIMDNFDMFKADKTCYYPSSIAGRRNVK